MLKNRILKYTSWCLVGYTILVAWDTVPNNFSLFEKVLSFVFIALLLVLPLFLQLFFRRYDTTKTSYGHPVYYRRSPLKYKRFYTDTNLPVEENRPRACKVCDMFPTSDGHDACIANLPGVEYACCGHGDAYFEYVKLYDGTVLRSLEEYYKLYPKKS